MEIVNHDILRFETGIKNSDGELKQFDISKETIIELKQITNLELQFEFYKNNLDNIYDYLYDGGNECVQTYNFEDIFIEEIALENENKEIHLDWSQW